MGARTAPGKRCLVEHRATEWYSPDPPPARMTGPGAVRWPNKKEPHTPGICAHTRALKNEGNDAIVYAQGHLRCVLRTGGDRTVQGDVSGRPAWVPSAIRVPPVHAQSTRSHLAASAAKACFMAETASEPGSSCLNHLGLRPRDDPDTKTQAQKPAPLAP